MIGLFDLQQCIIFQLFTAVKLKSKEDVLKVKVSQTFTSVLYLSKYLHSQLPALHTLNSLLCTDL